MQAEVKSPVRSAEIRQDGTNTTDGFMRILYALDTVVGADGLKYLPVDMGAGVAWADRNVGATATTDPGLYFYWGGTAPITSISTGQYYASIADIPNTTGASAEQFALPDSADAAFVVMGSNWRMPLQSRKNLQPCR